MCKTCSVEGCENKYYAKGYCLKHYKQIRRYGYILERTHRDLNEIIEYDDYAEIVLYDKNNKEIARAIIDVEDIDSVKKYKWHLSCNGYATNNKIGFLHRFIKDCPDDMVVDHKNNNPLDNRKDNLRICTQQQNSMNRSIQSNNTSGVVGVGFSESRNKWYAQIKINKKHKTLGYYENIEDAIQARRQAEIDYFGEYAPTKE